MRELSACLSCSGERRLHLEVNTMDVFDERIHERCHFDMSWMCAVCAHFIQRGEVCHQ